MHLPSCCYVSHYPHDARKIGPQKPHGAVFDVGAPKLDRATPKEGFIPRRKGSEVVELCCLIFYDMHLLIFESRSISGQ